MKHVLLGLLYRVQAPSTEIPARVVVARLLAAHAATRGTKLRAEASLASEQTRSEPESDKGRSIGLQG